MRIKTQGVVLTVLTLGLLSACCPNISFARGGLVDALDDVTEAMDGDKGAASGETGQSSGVQTTVPEKVQPAAQSDPASLIAAKEKRIADLDDFIKEWKYRIKKWSIDLKWRKDGLRRLRKGLFYTVEFVPDREKPEGFFATWWYALKDGLKAQTHSNVAGLEGEYMGEFTRYKAAKGEETYSIKELRKWLIPREEKYQQHMGQRLMEMEDELGQAQLRKRKLLEEIQEIKDSAAFPN